MVGIHTLKNIRYRKYQQLKNYSNFEIKTIIVFIAIQSLYLVYIYIYHTT